LVKLVQEPVLVPAVQVAVEVVGRAAIVVA
jgi:hypothetical protein